MKKLLILCTVIMLVLLPVALVIGCQKQPAPFLIPSVLPPIEALTYTNSEYGFSLDYPTDWDVEEGWKETVVSFTGPIVLKGADYQYAVSTLVAAEQLPEDITLKDYFLLTLNAQETAGFSRFTFSHGTISGLAAEIAVMSATLKIGKEKIPLKDILAILIKDNIGYVIAYDVPAEFHDEYLDAFELAVSTFKFE